MQMISFTQPDAVLVEASAGTGKTWLLERLYVKALLEANAPGLHTIPVTVTNLLVVTFTNDAADELKARIQEQLQKSITYLIYVNKSIPISDGDADEFNIYLRSRNQHSDYRQDILILTRALQNFDMAAIYTIHGFCNTILHDYPFECAASTMFTLVTNRSEIMQTLVLDFLQIEIINNVKLKPKIEIVLNNLHGLFRNYNNYQAELHELINNVLPKDLFKVGRDGAKLKYTINGVARLDGLMAEIPDNEAKVAVKAEFLACLIQYMLPRYLERIRLSEALAYDELVQKLADALDADDMADTLFAKFPIAFIDEFQDTDNLQWQIFCRIYHLNRPHKRGNVVLVGDPKQAIYRFRGADIDTYIEARGQINKQLALSKNYRASPNILNFINQLFNLNNQGCSVGNSFFGAGIDYLANTSGLGDGVVNAPNLLPPTDVLARLMHDAGSGGQEFYREDVQLVVIKGARKDIRTNNLLLNMTFEILALLKAEPQLVGKIAILVTKNSEASLVVKYLRKYGIRASELRLGSVFATDTALDLYVVLSAIFDLADRGLLRRALCCRLLNLSLASIMPSGDTHNADIIEVQQHFFALKHVWDTQGVIALIYKLMEVIVAGVSENKLQDRELANLWQLAELLHTQSLQLVNQAEVLVWLKNKISKADQQQHADLDGVDEELIRLDNDDAQITITTQHKAKGLEYDILFCPFFKNTKELDGARDYSYQRPFFNSYHKDGQIQHELITDKEIGRLVLDNENAEIHRLNYVALTRSCKRLYIYLKQNSRDIKTKTKYNALEKPDKLISLFGYNRNDPTDDTHRLFNYPQFFTDTPHLGIKNPDILPGVIAYSRDDLHLSDLVKLKIIHDIDGDDTRKTKLHYVHEGFQANLSYSRQSYTSITAQATDKDADVIPDLIPNPSYDSRYSVLQDKALSGASFGILFHKLCEKYPCSATDVASVLHEYNLEEESAREYTRQLMQMLDAAFNYPIMGGLGLNQIPHKVHELKFNLIIKNSEDIKLKLCQLIEQNFGVQHPFSQACKSLQQIKAGFLSGAIDLLFEYDGKYWVLDYKTNKLNDYQGCILRRNVACNVEVSELLVSMAEHHYYLQYLLYMVAVKRYLQVRLNIADATHLLGGVVYYYVRGVYAESVLPNDGVYIDKEFHELVAQIDSLLIA